MKTDALISLLACGVAPVDRHRVGRRFAWALLGAGFSAALLVMFLYGLRADIGAMLLTRLFWLKVAFPTTLALSALSVAVALSRPGAAIRDAATGLAFPVGLLWVCGSFLWWFAPADARMSLVFGHTWRSCPFRIALTSIPGFVAIFAVMRGLAPTRLRLAGAAAGLLAAAIATTAYCLHCPEMSPSFWAVWYVLGMAIPTIAGAIVGPRWLRW